MLLFSFFFNQLTINYLSITCIQFNLLLNNSQNWSLFIRKILCIYSSLLICFWGSNFLTRWSLPYSIICFIINVYYLYGPETHYVSVFVSINTVSLLFLPPAECWAGGPALGVGSHTHPPVACSEQDGDISGPDPLGAELLRRWPLAGRKPSTGAAAGVARVGCAWKEVLKWSLQTWKPVEVEFFSSLHSGLQAKSTQSQRSGAQSWGGRLPLLCQPSGCWCPCGAWHCSHDKDKLGPCHMTDERAVRNGIVCPTWFI